MAEKRTILVCSCEDTMPLDKAAIESGCPGADVETGRYLCRTEVERFSKTIAAGGDIVMGCTQEAPLFAELAGANASITFAATSSGMCQSTVSSCAARMGSVAGAALSRP